MTTEPKDVEQIFHSALEKRTPAERGAFLDGACGDDADLRASVEELLDAHQEAGQFLDEPIVDPDATVESRRITEGPGTTIGRYKLLEHIGEGGFGVVYMAEQIKPVQRKVALKIIKLGMDTKQVIARFEAERQALALMDHPNIAQVLDAGTTETGRPYFVMELVKGITITEYCDKNRLSTQQRLTLFKEVCYAVQHAHQKGVIHRDIKPSNVLVTLHDSIAVPKIIDFGIAKAISQRLTDKTLFTGFREFIGTPEYMSPDQAEISGLDVDTRTDVYSLGVVLYELLTGSTPFDATTLRSAPLEEVKRIIRDEHPPRPSVRVQTLIAGGTDIAILRQEEPTTLSKVIRGDLDWIVMKAMEKDRTRRYATANDLAADLQRYLNHEPVLAGPPSLAYKLSKFVRRHRVAVIAVLAVCLAMITGLSLATVGLIQATRARTALQAQRDAAQEARIEAEQARAHEEQQRRLAEDSASQAQREALKAATVSKFLRATLGSVDPSRALGREVTVRYVLDEAARKIEEGALIQQPEVEAELRITLGITYEALGVYDAAESHLHTAVAIRAQTLGEDHPDTLRSRSAVVGLLISQSQFGRAESRARPLVNAQRRVLGEEHPDLLTSMSRLGVATWQQGKLTEAGELIRQTLRMQQRVLGGEHVDTLRSAVNLGGVLLEQGEHAEAEALLRQALRRERRLLGQEHPETMAAMNQLARALERQGKYEQAEQLYRQTWELTRLVLGPEHPRTQIPVYNLLRVLRTQGKTADARPLVAARLGRLQRAALRSGADASALDTYAWELLTCEPEDMQDAAQALPIAQRAVELDGGKDPNRLDTLALAYRMTGHPDEAIEIQRQALAQARVGGTRGPYNVQEFENKLADLLWERADLLGAAQITWSGIVSKLGETLTTDSTPDVLGTVEGQVLIEEGRFQEAEQLLRGSLAMRQKNLPEDHWLTAEASSLLGEAVAKQGRFSEAEELLLQGYHEMQDSIQVPQDHRLLALRRIVELYESWGKADAAAAWRDKLGA